MGALAQGEVGEEGEPLHRVHPTPQRWLLCVQLQARDGTEDIVELVILGRAATEGRDRP